MQQNVFVNNVMQYFFFWVRNILIIYLKYTFCLWYVTKFLVDWYVIILKIYLFLHKFIISNLILLIINILFTFEECYYK